MNLSGELTAEMARELLDYNEYVGTFRWNRRARRWFQTDGAHNSWNNRYSGTIAGTVTDMSSGPRRVIGLLGRRYRASRLAWFLMTGAWPSGVIDHKDRCTTNDTWSNLRDATHSQNNQNRGKTKNNKSGFKGVVICKDRKRNRFAARICVRGNRYHLGHFATGQDASDAYETAAHSYFGHYYRRGNKS